MPQIKHGSKGKMANLCALLREDIVRGRLCPGALLPTQKELARKFGVAEATAAAAVGRLAAEGLAIRIHGRGSFVADEPPVRHEILDFVRTSGTFGAKDGAWALTWIEVFTRCAERFGWTPRWHHISETERQNVDQLANGLSDSKGIIVLFDVPPKFLWLCHQHGIPAVAAFVVVGGVGEGLQCYPQISYDRTETARLATEHLVSLGYSRIGFVGLKTSPLRSNGFLSVLSRHNLDVRGQWIFTLDRDIFRSGDESDRRCRDLCAGILRGKDRPEAICCSTLRTAYTVEAVAIEMGLKVPQDLALIACDETEPNISGEVSITTVAVSREESCKRALEVLDQIRSKPVSEKSSLYHPIMMPVRLTIKDSCGAKLKSLAGGKNDSQDS